MRVCVRSRARGRRGRGRDINIASNKFSKAPAISQQIVNSKFCARATLQGNQAEGKRDGREGRQGGLKG